VWIVQLGRLKVRSIFQGSHVPQAGLSRGIVIGHLLPEDTSVPAFDGCFEVTLPTDRGH